MDTNGIPFRPLAGITYGHRVVNARRAEAAAAIAQAIGDALFRRWW